MSTSVKQRTEDVALKPRALTLRAASSVRVNQDTPEMASHAKVRQVKRNCICILVYVVVSLPGKLVTVDIFICKCLSICIIR